MNDPSASIILSLRNALRSAVALCALSACQGQGATRAPQAFEPTTLKRVMLKLARDAAQLPSGDQVALDHFAQERLQPLLMTEQELISALQPKGGAPSAQVSALIKRYQETLSPAFLAEAPKVLAHAQKLGLSQVRVTRVGPSRGASNTPGDLKLLEALPKRPPLYHVRYLAEGTETSAQRGLRLNGFIYTLSGWKTLLKLGESLEAWRVDELK